VDRIELTPLRWDLKRLDEILEAANGYWSYEEHFEQMVEECAELIVALQKRKRALKMQICGKDEIDDIRRELADVLIMAAQLTKMLGDGSINKFIDSKGDKTVSLMENGLR
jgi:NTP pyrophosphatase (non-canonical NTP hydrolase)